MTTHSAYLTQRLLYRQDRKEVRISGGLFQVKILYRGICHFLGNRKLNRYHSHSSICLWRSSLDDYLYWFFAVVHYHFLQ